jgi:tetratricopeptide (TPR) repeat protein
MTPRLKVRLLAFLGAAIVAAGGYLTWRRFDSSHPPPSPPEIPVFITDEEVRGALTEARDQVLADPRSGDKWGSLGLRYRAHNLNAESNDCFAVAAKLDPQDPRWPYLIGAINLLLAPEEAVPHLRIAYRLSAIPAYKSAARLRLAEALLERKELNEAEQLFLEETQSGPWNARAQFGLGLIAVARGDYEPAIKFLTSAQTSPFAHRKAATILAAAYGQLQRPEEAQRFAQEASRGPQDLPWPDAFISEYLVLQAGRSARMQAVEKLEAEGRIPEAVAELESIARDSPDDLVLVTLGINLAKSGDYARAESPLRFVLSRSPEHAVGHYFLGISLFMQAEQLEKSGEKPRAETVFQEAIKELLQAAALKPDQGLAHLYAGFALKHLGKRPEAVEQFRAAIAASPQLHLTHFALAEALIDMEKPAEAMPHLEAAARLSPPGDTRAKDLLQKLGASGGR